jgi:hypothetical protein
MAVLPGYYMHGDPATIDWTLEICANHVVAVAARSHGNYAQWRGTWRLTYDDGYVVELILEDSSNEDLPAPFRELYVYVTSTGVVFLAWPWSDVTGAVLPRGVHRVKCFQKELKKPGSISENRSAAYEGKRISA